MRHPYPAIGALVLLLSPTSSVWAAGAEGRLTCEVTENGESAAGAVVLRRGGAEVARGTCGKPLVIGVGDYEAVLALDGALDGPERTQPVTIAAGATSHLAANFETGVLEVRIQSEGRRAAGMAIIRRDGVQIGTLGSGVSAHLSAGRYQVVARYRTQEKAFDAVVVGKGERVVLDAAF